MRTVTSQLGGFFNTDKVPGNDVVFAHERSFWRIFDLLLTGHDITSRQHRTHWGREHTQFTILKVRPIILFSFPSGSLLTLDFRESKACDAMAAQTETAQQVATQQTVALPEQNAVGQQYGHGPGQVPPRAEGYRPAAIRESRN
jgi:hypothetical protein